VRKLKRATAGDKPSAHAVLTPVEIAALIAATAPDWCPAIAVLAYGGLRIGELLGLTWGDVELSRGRLLVRRQLCGNTGLLREPKTARGQRFVELPSATIAALEVWKLRCPKGKLELVFPNTEGGPMNHFNFRGRVFTPALRRAGLRRVRVHDMRHTCASLLIATGCDIAAVSRQLGHANVATTLAGISHR
jgi:integrase